MEYRTIEERLKAIDTLFSSNEDEQTISEALAVKVEGKRENLESTVDDKTLENVFDMADIIEKSNQISKADLAAALSGKTVDDKLTALEKLAQESDLSAADQLRIDHLAMIIRRRWERQDERSKRYKLRRRSY